MARDPQDTIRLPFEALERLHDGTRRDLARRLGIASSQLYRFLRYGVTSWQADECAGRFGVHPLDVWGDAWSQANELDLSYFESRLRRLRSKPPTALQRCILGHRYLDALEELTS